MGERDHLEVIPSHNEKFIRIEKDINDLKSFNQKMIEVSANQTSSLERIHERLDDWNEQTRAIIQLGTSVEHMVEESKKTQESVAKAMGLIQEQHIRIRDIEQEKFEEKFKGLENKISILENKPGTTALKYLEKVFSYLLIAALGTILIALGYYAKLKFGG